MPRYVVYRWDDDFWAMMNFGPLPTLMDVFYLIAMFDQVRHSHWMIVRIEDPDLAPPRINDDDDDDDDDNGDCVEIDDDDDDDIGIV